MKGFTIGELVVIFAITALVVLLLYPSIIQTHNKTDRVNCANNLRELGRALYIYAKEHQGKFPDTIDTLYTEKYLSETSFVDCPATKHKGTPGAPEYTYTSGLSVKDDSGTVLIQDKEDSHGH